MRKFKKLAAIGLAMTLVIGSSLAAFADDPNSGASSGSGTSEGHVEEKATNVVLPTIAEGTTPFAYTMDPEGLIQETEGGKYTNAVFPDPNSDTHVYFNNGTNDAQKIVYANSSAKLKVENKSSHDIDLTVSVTASSAETDIPLVAQSALATAENASLYLGLKVDTEAAVAITTSTAATKEVTINGTPGNFKIAVNSGKTGYEYRVMTLDEYKAIEGNGSATALPWDSAEFQLEGEVTEDLKITSATTAPTVAVTWSWEDPTAAPATVDVTVKNKGDYTGADTTVTMTVGSTAVNPTAVDGYTFGGYYTDAELSTAFEGNVAADTTTLYAKWTENDIAPSLTPTEGTTDGSEDFVMAYSLGSGDSKATSVTGVRYSSVSASVAEKDANSSFFVINAEAKTVTIPADKLTILKNAGYSDVTFYLVFDTGAKASCVVTIE